MNHISKLELYIIDESERNNIDEPATDYCEKLINVLVCSSAGSVFQLYDKDH